MKIALFGHGKMGKEIQHQLLQAGHEIPIIVTSANVGTISTTELQQCDVAIEFTQPAAVMKSINLCFQAKLPMVIGTTGWQAAIPEVKTRCQNESLGIIYASNFSIGVNLFFLVNKYLTHLMNQNSGTSNAYQINIAETHHIHKKDAPSGTAISLQQIIQSQLNSNSQPLIPIQSTRIGEVIGQHQVTYTSAIDTLTIEHQAHNRSGFASGAIQAAAWIKDKTGFFEMTDMIEGLIQPTKK